MTRTEVSGLEQPALAAALRGLDLPRYTPRQVFRWIHGKQVFDFSRMTDLSLAARARLAESCEVRLPAVTSRDEAPDGTTRYGYRLADGERTESVFIPGEPGQATLCLSSQVGCPLGCTFCVSGLIGVKRNLTAAEITGQALAMLAPGPPRNRINVVFMGMGEALLNLEALVPAYRVLADADGLAIALRRMTVSTAGHVPAIARFGELAERPHLAVSLNAATDDVRSSIMPINRAWPLHELLGACRRFPLRKGELLTFEYVLLAGVNDSLDDARRLPGLVAGIPCKVNLIPWNPAAGFPYRTPADDTVDRFAEVLSRRRLTVTVRRRRGTEVGAACGQLAIQRSDPAGSAALR